MLAHCLLASSLTQKLGIEPSGSQRPLCICPVYCMLSLFSTSEATGTFQILLPITALTQHLPWYVLQSDAIAHHGLQALRYDHGISHTKLQTSAVRLLIRDMSHCLAADSACTEQHRWRCLYLPQPVCVSAQVPNHNRMKCNHRAVQLLSLRTPVKCKTARCVPTQLTNSYR